MISSSNSEFVEKVVERVKGLPDSRKFIIKDANNSKLFRAYFAYLISINIAEAVRQRGEDVSSLGMPGNIRQRLIEAEKTLRLQYDIPDDKIPYQDHLEDMELITRQH